jgi:hypothetical protein
MNEKKKKVRFIKPPNVLKNKVGTGGIDEKLLEKSQETISNTEVDFIPFAKQFLKQLADFTAQAQISNEEFKEAKEKIIGPVMQLKANGGMFRYQLLSDVADIALQFLESIETCNNDTFDVIKAHEKTLQVIIANKLKGDGGPAGYALIKELDQACQRYFSKYGQKEDPKEPKDLAERPA